MPRPNDSPPTVTEFYDQFADAYHFVYGGDGGWDVAVERQGLALDRLIRELHGPETIDVLDCSCGIGTQAIGLALRGHRVVGTDISERSVERARIEAARFGVDVSFGVADFRDLSAVEGLFDVVISCDNAIPHLERDSEIVNAFAAMRSKLRPDGLLVVSVRDYDRAMIERPGPPLPLLLPGTPRRLLLRLQDWDAPDSPLHSVRFLILSETASGWTVEEHSTRYRAVGRASLTSAAEAAGLADIAWLDADAADWHQPVMTARHG
jgi:glycine/sarcosine N-methyltransferase